MLPVWADVLILSALPLILGLTLWLFAEDDPPDNGITHDQVDEEIPPAEMLAA